MSLRCNLVTFFSRIFSMRSLIVNSPFMFPPVSPQPFHGCGGILPQIYYSRIFTKNQQFFVSKQQFFVKFLQNIDLSFPYYIFLLQSPLPLSPLCTRGAAWWFFPLCTRGCLVVSPFCTRGCLVVFPFFAQKSPLPPLLHPILMPPLFVKGEVVRSAEGDKPTTLTTNKQTIPQSATLTAPFAQGSHGVGGMKKGSRENPTAFFVLCFLSLSA